MAFELSRIDRLYHTVDLNKLFPGKGPFTSADLAILPVGRNPTATNSVWYAATVEDDLAGAFYAGPDADSTGAIPVPTNAQLWVKRTGDSEVDAAKADRITVLGGGAWTSTPSVQALIGLDTDGVPFYDPGGIGTPAALTLDLDGVLYFTP